MEKQTINIKGLDMDVYCLNTVIVGTGAAGFNAADSLYSMGQQDIAIVTEGVDMGTSRNTGSDKQTYYKLTAAGDAPDSVVEMAKTLFNGGCMHGDIALVEAALSARCFYKLVDYGVPFPHNRYGEYIGYKTDHDPRQRATSAGPLTSRFMTEKLEVQVANKGIKILNGFLVIGILTKKYSGDDICSIGLIALDNSKIDSPNMGFTLFNCTNIIYATGGPAGMYLSSVYPEGQTGASGIAFEAGAKAVNLTESQYGIASVKFRWNLSGTYQQVIPRYISVDSDGNNEKEFLDEYFDDSGKMLDAIFLKGYQWPFDPGKVENYGSSLIDLLVYNETQIRGRKVFLDFTRNPGRGGKSGKLDFSLLGSEAYNYLENSGALYGTPIERLAKMNQPAINLYMDNGIDITKEYLEIAVCAQHNNGGLTGNIWWESNIRHLFPVGEVNGTFGVYRPGGSALNSTQVGSLRAAQFINANYRDHPLNIDEFCQTSGKEIERKLDIAHKIAGNVSEKSNIMEIRKRAQKRMTVSGGHIRFINGVNEAIGQCLEDLLRLTEMTQIRSIFDLPDAFRNRDILMTQFVYLNSIKEYINKGGGSRGSYLIQESGGEMSLNEISEEFRFKPDSGKLLNQVCEIGLMYNEGQLECISEWKPVRPIPVLSDWYENIWNDFRNERIIK